MSAEVDSTEAMGFFARLWLGFILPWKIIFDGQLAGRVSRAQAPDAFALPEPAPAPAPEPPPVEVPAGIKEVLPEAVPEPETPAEPDTTAALQLLTILQREGRLVDFLYEDVAGADDGDVGAAARVVHEGCRRVLDKYLKLSPVRDEPEGERITLAPGFDALRNRVTGNVVGEPPFSGELVHPGWKVTEISLPTIIDGHDASIIAPAEIEL